MKKLLLFLSLCLVSMLSFNSNAQCHNKFYTVDNASDQLSVYDTLNGSLNLLTAVTLTNDIMTTIDGGFGLATNPDDSVIYILYQDGGGISSRRLGTLDTITGVITDIGVSGNLTDISFGIDGTTLYGTTGSDGASHDFVSVDMATGAITVLFTHLNQNYGPSIGYDATNNIMLKMAGQSDDVTSIVLGTLVETDLVFTNHPGEIHTINQVGANTFYVTNYSELLEYNSSTGEFTSIINVSDNIHGATFGTAILNYPVASFTATPSPIDLSLNPDGMVYFENTGATGVYSWDFDNGIYSTNENVWVPLSTNNGSFDVTLTVIDAFGCSATATQTINAINALGIEELGLSLSAFPNPTKDFVTIESKDGNFNASILDLKGNELKTFKIKEGKNNTIDIASYSAGLYLIKVEQDGKIGYIRLIKE